MKMPSALNVRLSGVFLGIILLMAIFADFIANDRPIITIEKDGVSFFTSPHSQVEPTTEIFAPIPFKGGLDLRNTMLKPFESSNHLFGTDHLGRDILAGIIHGSRTSVGISLLAILISCLIGLLLGGLAGFTGDRRYAVSPIAIILGLLAVISANYFLISVGGRWFAFLFSMLLLILAGNATSRMFKVKSVRIPVDFIVLKFIELFSAVPTYFLVLALVAFVQPNWWMFAILIGATSWVGIAKLVRAEMIKIRSMGYIQSAEALGLSKSRIFIRHALPNALGPLPYAFTFGIAAIVVMESTLSYFGVGLPADSLSWGNFVSGFKNNSSAWWVALFPGLMIFCTILSLHIVGRWLDDHFNPREKTI